MTVTQKASSITVQSVMQRTVLKATCTESVRESLETMLANHVSSLPVVDDSNLLVGIVSLHDLASIASAESDVPVSSVMTDSPATVQPEETIDEAAKLMIVNQIHHLPVVRKDQTLVGFLSAIDYVRLASDGLLTAAT